jgi:propionyl-CoA synthetase
LNPPSSVRIVYLADVPACTGTLAAWHHAEWGGILPGWSREEALAELSTHTGRRGIPTTLVALDGETPVGSASLLGVDMPNVPDLTPWLASVFVAPEHRGRGIGGALVDRAVAETSALGIPNLYAFTTEAERYYTRRGWRVIQRLDYEGHPAVILQRTCAPSGSRSAGGRSRGPGTRALEASRRGTSGASPGYEEVYARWLADPEGFWAEAAEAIAWYHRWNKVLDAGRAPFYRWFTGGVLNTCHNALDRHVAGGRADQPALIYDSPMTGVAETFTYRQLLDQVSRFAGVLAAEGVRKGDRVLIYMPMVPETAIAMLACARIGAVHSVVFGGFAANELATRISDARPRVVLSASCGLEPGRKVAYKPMLDEAIEMASARPERCIILQRPQEEAPMVAGRDLDWAGLMSDAEPAECVPVAATDPLYILYTSGTTGIPKGVVRDTGGHAVALQWSMQNIYGVAPGEVFWAASDLGWAVGHSYIVYGPLLNGSTGVLYEGKPVGTPDPGAFWRVISQHDVRALFTAPTAFRAIRREDPEGEHIRRYDLSGLRTLFLAGERCDPETLLWGRKQLGVPVIDHWWQTETGWPVGANCVGLGMLPVKPGSCGKPVPGYDVRVLGSEGQEVPAGQIGNVAIRLPLPPGCLPTLWNNDAGYERSYLSAYPGYYATADAGYVDADGYLWIMSRTDDIINVAGHRLSTGAMEEVLASHPDVAECAVVGVADELKGEIPLGLVVLKARVRRDHAEIVSELVGLVRERIGPVASFKVATVVERLPKTRSGKVLRGTIKKIADGVEYRVPPTIDDPAILEEIADRLAALGYARGGGPETIEEGKGARST